MLLTALNDVFYFSCNWCNTCFLKPYLENLQIVKFLQYIKLHRECTEAAKGVIVKVR